MSDEIINGINYTKLFNDLHNIYLLGKNDGSYKNFIEQLIKMGWNEEFINKLSEGKKGGS